MNIIRKNEHYQENGIKFKNQATSGKKIRPRHKFYLGEMSYLDMIYQSLSVNVLSTLKEKITLNFT